MKRLLRSRMTLVGGVLVLAVIFACTFPSCLSSYNPRAFSPEQLAAPSSHHPFGTDSYGRDVLSLVLNSGWGTLVLAAATLLVSAGVGIPCGILAGYSGGGLDMTLSRIVDVLMSFPAMMVALLVVGFFGSAGRGPLIVAIGLTLVPRFARVMRGSALPFRSIEYITAARSVGASRLRILLRHVLPNLVAPIIVLCSTYLPYVILLESSLSFLGLGAPPDSPTWGRIVADGRHYFRAAPWLVVFPGLTITLAAIGFNLLGDGLRDVLDPHLRGRMVQ
ncbi:MAG: ABC transporter permease [Thermotogota bacterium]